MKDDSMNPDSDTNIVAVELRDIRFTYDAGATWALDGVNLTIRQGERVCLAGPNGSGKSTLSRIIAGLAAPDAGHVTLLGNNVFDESGAHADAYRSARHGIGAVFQHPEDQIVTTITEDDVAFGPENLAIAHDDIDMRIAMSLDAVDMSEQREADPTRMSGGQQQRVAIAGILAMNPEILVLDEPTAMLDPQGRADIMHILDELQQHGTTIILVTHHRDEFANADRIIRLDNGSIVQSAHGDTASIPEMDESDTAQEDNPIAKSNIANGASKPASAVPIIEIRNLTYQYPNSNKPVLTGLLLFGYFNTKKIRILAEFTLLREICCDPRLVYADAKNASAKLDAICELVSTCMDEGKKVLVFSQFTSFLDLIGTRLAEQGVDFYTITGETPKKRRVELVDEFNGNDVPVFLISLKAGNTGLNLVGASVVVHADPWWNAAAQNQATDRAHRIGQTQDVNVYQIVAKDTIEERILKLQEKKSELAQQFTDGTASGGVGTLSKDDLLGLLS